MKSQSDIAQENQEGLEKANKRDAKQRAPTDDQKATRFDGSSEQKHAGGVFKLKDDTPWRLEKREEK